jgi:hypothetical protein
MYDGRMGGALAACSSADIITFPEVGATGVRRLRRSGSGFRVQGKGRSRERRQEKESGKEAGLFVDCC